MKITVNTKPHEISGERVTYEQIAELAGKPHANYLTMTYHGSTTIDGEKYEKNGSLRPGQSVKIVDGMHFSAVYTGSA